MSNSSNPFKVNTHETVNMYHTTEIHNACKFRASAIHALGILIDKQRSQTAPLSNTMSFLFLLQLALFCRQGVFLLFDLERCTRRIDSTVARRFAVRTASYEREVCLLWRIPRTLPLSWQQKRTVQHASLPRTSLELANWSMFHLQNSSSPCFRESNFHHRSARQLLLLQVPWPTVESVEWRSLHLLVVPETTGVSCSHTFCLLVT